MATARFLLVRLKNSAASSARRFSSSAAVLRPWSHDRGASEESDGQSPVYKRKLKLQRPNTIRYDGGPRNSVSLIGEIVLPLKACKSEGFGVHTILRAKNSSGVCPYYVVMLKFWDKMAEVSVQHLKPNDLVYVSGHLRSYMKIDENGKSLPKYEVDVSEVKYVTQHRSQPACQNVSAEDMAQKRRDRHHLWQVFFANPYEWWDNRNCKKNPRMPDFKHKDTGEALWITDNDPPWISQQLRLIGSRLGQPRNSRLTLSSWDYDDDDRRT